MAEVTKVFGDRKRGDLLKLAKLAEQAERFEDMAVFMKKIVEAQADAGEELLIEERNLLSVAYKNIVGAKRQSWRTLDQGKFDETKAEDIAKYKGIVEDELSAVCGEVLALLKNKLIKQEKSTNETEAETQAFYKKMCGDYNRYLCEFYKDDKLADTKKACNKWYTEAMKEAENLQETHPTRLGIALNWSVCQYEILQKKEEACKIAKDAFDQAIQKLDKLEDGSYKDSTMIMQLLRDNLTLWTATEEEPQD